jgi:hypothetical protein
MEFSFNTLIKDDLWAAAKWRDTAVLHLPNHEAEPGLALMFEDFPAGQKLFDDLRAQLGIRDVSEYLRVTIIEGEHSTKGEGFTVHITLDPLSVPPADNPDSYYAVSGRWRFKAVAGGSASVKSFKDGYRIHGKYFIVPMDLATRQPDMARAIEKQRIYLTSFDGLSLDDVAADALNP